MEWFRHYHGLCTDPKLHKISRNAKVSRAIIIAAWCAVLEHASQQEIRGDVSDIEPADLAFLIDQKPSVAQRIWDAILASDLIVDGRVAAWEKYAPIERMTRHQWMVNRQRMIEESPYCVYCGDASGPFDIDHITPRAKGGDDSSFNLAVSCQKCNRSKKDMPLEWWLQ